MTPLEEAVALLEKLWEDDCGDLLGYAHLTRNDYNRLHELLEKLKNDNPK